MRTCQPEANFFFPFISPYIDLLPTRVCFTNAGINTNGARIETLRESKRFYRSYFELYFSELA